MQPDIPKRVVVGITGASGAAYAARVLALLAEADVEMHLVVTSLGKRLLFDELGMKKVDPDFLTNGRPELVTVHNDADHGAHIASGSFLHQGMIVVPCSSNTLGAISAGITQNLLQRAAAVALKERRPLVIAHRESPLSLVDIENMKRVTEAGGIITPLAPGFYLKPRSLGDIIDFMAGKLLDLVGVPHNLSIRWDEHLDTV
jgi:4-hydroxy-3-polyprenylbenzoate decarboxylase